MDLWNVGLAVILVVALVAVVFGALYDRSRNRRATAEMLSPPKRDIPHFAPESPAPHYLTELQARRRPERRLGALTPTERDKITQQFSDPATVTLTAGYTSADFITDEGTGWAVLDQPCILVCSEPVQSMREILSVLEPFAVGRTPLVLVVPQLAREVQATLEVNAIQSTMRLLVVMAESSQRQKVAEATGAEPTTRADLQAGYLPPDRLGRCQRWVSDATRSYLVGPGGRTTGARLALNDNGDAPTDARTSS